MVNYLARCPRLIARTKWCSYLEETRPINFHELRRNSWLSTNKVAIHVYVYIYTGG